jgi:hypothetical protein
MVDGAGVCLDRPDLGWDSGTVASRTGGRAILVMRPHHRI